MKKSILIFSIVLVLLLLVNWWAGRQISEQIDIQIEHLLSPEQAATFRYGNITASPLLARITFENVTYRDADRTEYQFKTVRSSFTYRDLLSLPFRGAQGLDEISYLSLYLRESVFTDPARLGKMAFDEGNLIVEGDVKGALEALMQRGRFPSASAMHMDLNEVRFSPSEQVRQEFGMMAQAFGLNLNDLFIDRISGRYLLEGKRIVLDDAAMETAFFVITANMEIALNQERRSQSVITEGSLRFSDMTPGVHEFFENVETLFSVEFQRDNSDILIFVEGPVASPEVQWPGD